MQIALVAAALFAGMWFTVLRPKNDNGSTAPVAQAPGVTGLANDVAKAKAASATSDAANASIQKATGGDAAATPAKAAAPAKAAPAKAVTPAKHAAALKPAATKAAKKPAALTGDPSDALLANLAHGKTVVLLFAGDGADDRAARKAVHEVALTDKKVVSAYRPISQVGAYQAITSDVQVSTAPTILVIGTNRKAIALTGFVDAGVVRQAVGDARRAAAAKSGK